MISTNELTVTQLAQLISEKFPELSVDVVRMRILRAIDSGDIQARRVQRSPLSKKQVHLIPQSEVERVVQLYGEWLKEVKGTDNT